MVLFFEKGSKTRKVWYYQLDPGRNMGKTNPLKDEDLAEFVKLQKTFADSPKSWSVDANAIDPATFDLSVKNPNGGEEVTHRSPQAIIEEIIALDAESAEVLAKSRRCYETMVGRHILLAKCAKSMNGGTPKQGPQRYWDRQILWVMPARNRSKRPSP